MQVISKQKFKHGFFEVKARSSASVALKNSIFLQGKNSEINIIEYITEGTLGQKSQTNFHCWDDGADGSDVQHGKEAFATSAINFQNWHTFGLEWSADKLVFYLDGKVQRTLIKSVFTQNHANCMNEEMNIIMSIEAAKAHGVPTSADYPEGKAKSLLIQHVRHWQEKAPAPDGEKTCAELGWTPGMNAKAPHNNVCSHPWLPHWFAADKTEKQICWQLHPKNVNNKNYQKTRKEAVESCSAIGARLCSMDEYKSNVIKKIGCNHMSRKYLHTLDSPDNKQITFMEGKECKTRWGVQNSVLMFWGQAAKAGTRLAQCAYKTRKAHFRCCAGAATADVGQAEASEKSIIGGAPVNLMTDTGAASSGGTVNPEPGGLGSAATATIAMGVALAVVAAMVAVGFSQRRTPTLVEEAERKAVAAEGGRRTSFEDCIDAVSIAQSETAESMDILPIETAGNTAPESEAEDPMDFEENGFVLTKDASSLRIKSVRRGNPAFLQSVYLEQESIGDGAINQASDM